MKKLSILGSTGSIGVQALEVAEERGFSVAALTAGNNIRLLEQQIRRFRPSAAAAADENAARQLKIAVADLPVKIYSGLEGVCACAQEASCDTVLNSVVGIAGLRPTLAALQADKTLCLANKESLVAGGALVTGLAAERQIKILPVDSEHSAIFQCLEGQDRKALKKILLTASGGPFFGETREDLACVTLEQALSHPNWSMGAKITVDSATMFNKGLELIEAVYLFGVRPEQVEILVHRESVVHSMVEFDDNSVIAQMGVPDMRLPIQYSLTYPRRVPGLTKSIDLAVVSCLHFCKPDETVFGCIGICRDAIGRGGLFPAAVNSANEEANRLFREGKIPFLQIEELIRSILPFIEEKKDYSLDDIMNLDAFVRKKVLERLKN